MGGAFAIVDLRRGMLVAVEFNHQMTALGTEVSKIQPDRALTVKLEAKLLVAQALPQSLLGLSRIAP
jgi:hypothetical protein